MSPLDHEPARGSCVVTEPAPHQIRYELAVRLPALRPERSYVLMPWLAIRADDRTGEVVIAAGIRAQRCLTSEDDAA